MSAGYEYKRTCDRCGAERYVPADIAEAKPRKQAKMSGWATPLVGRRRQELRSQQALVDMQNATLEQARQCPQCGSSAYSEERVAI